MDTNTNSPIASGSQMPTQASEHKSIGPAAGVIIVLVLLIAAGLYFWGAKLSEDMTVNAPPYIPGDMAEVPIGASDAAIVESTAGLPPQSTADDTASIEADFNQMNLDAIDAQASTELNNI